VTAAMYKGRLPTSTTLPHSKRDRLWGCVGSGEVVSHALLFVFFSSFSSFCFFFFCWGFILGQPNAGHVVTSLRVAAIRWVGAGTYWGGVDAVAGELESPRGRLYIRASTQTAVDRRCLEGGAGTWMLVRWAYVDEAATRAGRAVLSQDVLRAVSKGRRSGATVICGVRALGTP